MPDRSRKRPADACRIVKSIVDRATGNVLDPDAGKDVVAVALGQKGGLKGGKARAESTTAKERSASAKEGAQARWKKLGNDA